MRKKSNNTHAAKKDLKKDSGAPVSKAPLAKVPETLELFSLTTSSKPVAEKFATAVQLQAFTGLDDAQLRRLGNAAALNPATSAPWVPKPVRGEYPVTPTVLGALAWWRSQASKPAGDHPIYADMEDADTRGLIPREFQQFAKKKGVDFINANRSIQSAPLRRMAADILRKIFSSGAAQIKGIEGLEELDSDIELAKVRREDARERARENALAEERIHNRDRVEETLWDNALAPLRAGRLNLRKTVFNQIDDELNKAQTPAAHRELVQTILHDALAGLLAHIRNHFPKNVAAAETSEAPSATPAPSAPPRIAESRKARWVNPANDPAERIGANSKK